MKRDPKVPFLANLNRRVRVDVTGVEGSERLFFRLELVDFLVHVRLGQVH